MLASAAERLRQALDLLAQGNKEHLSRPLTVSALCELAAVSRNSLYRYHADVLKDLRALKLSHAERQPPVRRAGTVRTQETELASLRVQVSKLASLLDHYYQAYKEAQALLSRREQELSDLRKRLDHRPAELRRG